jgi:orotate phosphoribosyltransferase-like protein
MTDDNWLAKLKPADQKVVKAREMRLSGAHYHEIAEKLGVTPDQAWALVKDGVKVNQGAGVAVERWVQAGRLDNALKIVLDILEDDSQEPDVRLKACAQFLAIEARRAKLLGLDAPELKIIQALDDDGESKKEKATPQRAAQLMREAFGLVGPTANEATAPSAPPGSEPH